LNNGREMKRYHSKREHITPEKSLFKANKKSDLTKDSFPETNKE